MSFKVPPARKKRKPTMSFKNSLPIFLTSDAESEPPAWVTFTGNYIHGIVTVEDCDEARALWENGFFGQTHGRREENKVKPKGSSGINSALGTENAEYTEDNEKITNNLKITCDPQQPLITCDPQQPLIPHSTVKMAKKPTPILEGLYLSPEEALFLSYALGILVLSNEEGKEMDIDNMWTSFCQLNKQFPVQYAIYHHFRCKDWVVKQGFKFGADWVLYPVGPPFYHSQFLVWVQCLWEDTLDIDTSLSSRRTDVADLCAFERLCGTVAKNALLCHVFRPRTLTANDLESIECLKSFIINEHVLQRGMPTALMTLPKSAKRHLGSP